MIVYSILNQHTGKRYIGYTTQGLVKRRDRHLSKLRRDSHHNAHLQSAWNQGDRYLLWIILEVCSSVEEVKTAETKWIAHYNTTDNQLGYNLTHGGDGVIPTIESRRKLSAARAGKKMSPLTPEHRAKISAALKGRKHSPERIAAHVGMKGRRHTEETRAKIGAKSKGRIPWNKSQ